MGNGIVKFIRFICECVLELIYAGDNKCIICDKDTYNDSCICDICSKKIKFCIESMSIVRDSMSIITYSAAYYSGIIKELIVGLKYKNDFKCGELLAQYMEDVLKGANFHYDLIVYVPSSRTSLKKRGYNQCRHLAKIIARNQNKPVYNCLKKTMETKDQIGLDGASRWENMIGVFKVVNKNIIKNKKILLIDDVITTGATAFYCAKELTDCGAHEVRVLTAAKSKI
ncbi:ComF family protein [Clostridium omnivorum]|uniref:Amidophosphoribosyltransferase n=1 Tax=Clostridium omnivorum TaxID=1604902 RepID=A0ABQ5N2R9_9CLOT|nr:ComF family protein [Clostridium sp. E14]GLC29350.1 amidophosphoribosyltransferase [Clostridium sp. E14]